MDDKVISYKFKDGKILDNNGKEVVDKKKHSASKTVIESLQKAGIVSFSGRRSGLDWDMIKSDAEILGTRFGVQKKPE